MRMGLTAGALVAAVWLPACAGPTMSLSAEGRRVMLLRYDHNRGAQVEPLGRVVCAAELDGRGQDANAIACENHLLNQAAEMGGDLVVVEMMRIDEDSAAMIGQVYEAVHDGEHPAARSAWR